MKILGAIMTESDDDGGDGDSGSDETNNDNNDVTLSLVHKWRTCCRPQRNSHRSLLPQGGSLPLWGSYWLSAAVTWPEHPKGAKDDVKKSGSGGPEGPKTVVKM